MCGLDINIASFAHLLNRVDFNAIVDHLALTHIIKSKVEPATTRIKRLSSNLYYIKGKAMVLSDLLSRQKHDDSNPMKSYLFCLTCKAYYKLDIIIKQREPSEIFSSDTITSKTTRSAWHR